MSKQTHHVNGSLALFAVRNALYLGNYALCLSSAADVKITDDEIKLERDILLYRANIGLHQYQIVLNGIKDDNSTPFGLRVNQT